MAAIAVGMPITSPEKVEVPPKCWAYSLEDDTMMKKVSCRQPVYKMQSCVK